MSGSIQNITVFCVLFLDGFRFTPWCCHASFNESSAALFLLYSLYSHSWIFILWLMMNLFTHTYTTIGDIMDV